VTGSSRPVARDAYADVDEATLKARIAELEASRSAWRRAAEAHDANVAERDALKAALNEAVKKHAAQHISDTGHPTEREIKRKIRHGYEDVLRENARLKARVEEVVKDGLWYKARVAELERMEEHWHNRAILLERKGGGREIEIQGKDER
jgi:hypothetical protein